MKKNVFVLLFLFVGVVYVHSQIKSIKNGIIWRDTEGNRMQVNGGNIIEHNNIYYMMCFI